MLLLEGHVAVPVLSSVEPELEPRRLTQPRHFVGQPGRG